MLKRYETGAQLFLTARDIPKLEKVIDNIVASSSLKDAPRPEALELHLDSLDGVREAAEDFKKRSNGQLNILINNAGMMASPYGMTKDGFEMQFGTNHLAHFLLFRLVKPLLLKSATESGISSRVVNLTSVGHQWAGINFDDMNYTKDPASYDKWKAYGQSKTANIYMASSIERHYGSKGLHGMSVHPGGIVTELGRHLQESDYATLAVEKYKHVYKSPEQGAATTVWAAVSPHFEVENGGRYLADVSEQGPMPKGEGLQLGGYASHIYDAEAEEKLWKLSLEAVGLPAND